DQYPEYRVTDQQCPLLCVGNAMAARVTAALTRVGPAANAIEGEPPCSIAVRKPLDVNVLVGPVLVHREQRFVDMLAQRTGLPDGHGNLVGPEYRADDLQHAIAALRGQVLKDRAVENNGL